MKNKLQIKSGTRETGEPIMEIREHLDSYTYFYPKSWSVPDEWFYF